MSLFFSYKLSKIYYIVPGFWQLHLDFPRDGQTRAVGAGGDENLPHLGDDEDAAAGARRRRLGVGQRLPGF